MTSHKENKKVKKQIYFNEDLLSKATFKNW